MIVSPDSTGWFNFFFHLFVNFEIRFFHFQNEHSASKTGSRRDLRRKRSLATVDNIHLNAFWKLALEPSEHIRGLVRPKSVRKLFFRKPEAFARNFAVREFRRAHFTDAKSQTHQQHRCSCQTKPDYFYTLHSTHSTKTPDRAFFLYMVLALRSAWHASADQT